MIADQTERNLARTALDQSLAVEAGAGSGKTSLLVDRVVNILLSGTPPSRVAAITFTERAAGELQERVFDQLENRFRNADGAERQVLEEALGGLAEMRVSTVHAFCRWLLTSEALEAGWAPGTAILGEGLEPPVVDQAFEEWWLQFDEDHPEHVLPVRQVCTSYSLLQGAKKLVEYRDLRPHHGPETVDWEQTKRDLSRAVKTLGRYFQHHCHAKESCKLYNGNIEALGNWQNVIASDNFQDAAMVALGWHNAALSKTGGRKADWSVPKNDVKGVIDEIRDWQETWKKRVYGPVHRAVVRHMHQHLLPDVKARKRAAGQADFTDLLFRVAVVLQERPAIRQRLAERFDAILIDEVQDTDPLQAEIAMLLGRSVAHEGAWDAHPPQPGRLFAVGDPKQSIYRFRRADVEMWNALRGAIIRSGQRVTLKQNFRSVPGLVNWYNHTFAALPDYQPQVAYRSSAHLDPVVAIDVRPYGRGERAEKIDAMIRHLQQLMNDEQLVVDPDSGEARPIRWGDVMVLLPSWTAAGQLHDQLVEAGIPCHVQGGKTFFERDEVRLAVAALESIGEPSAETSTVMVLRGLFGFSLQDLLQHRRDGGSWRYTIRDQPAGPVTEALKVLRTLHYQRNRERLGTLLNRLLSHTRAPVVWSLTARRESIPANLEKLQAILRDIELTARSPGEALTMLTSLARSDDEDLSLFDHDSDALRITTLFKAKGLEAPVVCLPLPSRRKGGVLTVFNREEGTVAVKMKSLVPPDWDTLKATEEQAILEERRRWMYVAATRARDQLVILDDGSQKKACLLEPDLRTGLPELKECSHGEEVEVSEGTRVRVLDPAQLPAVTYEQDAFPGLDNIAEECLQQHLTLKEPLEEAHTRRVTAAVKRARSRSTSWRTVTELASQRRVRKRRVEEQPGAEDRPSSIGVTGGDLVHQVIHRLDLGRSPSAHGDSVHTLTRALGRDMGLPEDLVEECERIVLEILQHPAMEQVRNAPERWQEVPFCHPERGGQVNGTIDLCCPLDEARTRWLVVDFKTHIPAEGSRSRAQYADQLRRYARALIATITPCEEVETQLIGPFPVLVEADSPALLELTLPCMQPGMERILAEGVPEPRVGDEFATASGDRLVLEWAWPHRKLGVALDLADEDMERLRKDGWEVLSCSELESGSIEYVVESLLDRKW